MIIVAVVITFIAFLAKTTLYLNTESKTLTLILTRTHYFFTTSSRWRFSYAQLLVMHTYLLLRVTACTEHWNPCISVARTCSRVGCRLSGVITRRPVRADQSAIR